MPDHTKIATCSYCGTRAALVLRGAARHELSCASCGAPLHDLKRLPSEAVRHHSDNPRLPAPEDRGPRQGRADHRIFRDEANRHRKRAKGKRKGFARRVLKEAFDLIEDIFD
ncbi:hypothetical protein E0K89_007750 [Aquicoccus sp. SCR17]|nr:hypothetical protein [Carideicomes alvinocaridis]